MNEKAEVIIVGGGLAGLTSGIHLRKLGIPVTLFEKNEYPKHKVCGEYVSNEILPYWNSLGISVLEDLNPSKIDRLQFCSLKGQEIETELPLGGFGISRYVLDNYLMKKAVEAGCQIKNESVENVVFENDEFTVTTNQNSDYKAKIVLGAFGKRSNLDQKMNRGFWKQKSPWLAVKAHYSGDFPSNLVGLYHFKGGYCGVSKVENDVLNICYLADYETFKKHRDVETYQKEVLSKNPELKRLFEECKSIFEKPLTISQISFERKNAVENHVLMIGDSAGLIHPLCGNGMAMAVHSAKIASELIIDFFEGKLSRIELEQNYVQQWNLAFKKRLQMGRILSNVMQKPELSGFLVQLLKRFPFVLTFIVKRTHGHLLEPF